MIILCNLPYNPDVAHQQRQARLALGEQFESAPQPRLVVVDVAQNGDGTNHPCQSSPGGVKSWPDTSIASGIPPLARIRGLRRSRLDTATTVKPSRSGLLRQRGAPPRDRTALLASAVSNKDRAGER